LLVNFKKFFKQKYAPFFSKAPFSTREEAVKKLTLAIKAQNLSLCNQFPVNAEDDEEE